MKDYLHDILFCLKILVYIYIPTFVIGIIIGLLAGNHNYVSVLGWGTRLNYWVACIGLSLAGVGLWRREKEDENTEEKERRWRMRFYVLRFPVVVFIISFLILFCSFFIDSLI